MYSVGPGRFLQPDPLDYWDDYNLYRYCHNNPVNWIDPFGLASLTVYSKKRSQKGLGHSWTGVTTNNGITTTRGNYPGGVRDDSNTTSDTSYTWEISESQAEKTIEALSNDSYNFFNDNCVDMVEDALDAAGVEHPDFDTLGISDPNKVADWLNEQNQKNKNDDICK